MNRDEDVEPQEIHKEKEVSLQVQKIDNGKESIGLQVGDCWR